MLDLSKIPHKEKRDGKLLLIDGDYLTHTSASSADGRTYVVEQLDLRKEFKYKKEATEWCEANCVPTEAISLEYHPEPVENCLHNCKELLKGILDGCGSDNYQIYVHGGGNFREEIYPEYKANRKDMRRPHHLEAVKQYLVDQWGAILVHDQETDDKLGIEQMKEFNGLDPIDDQNTIIISHDKDLDCIPGWHYRVKRGVPTDQGETYFVDTFESWKNFFKQCLTGDSTDNIPGMYKILGKKATKKYLNQIDECLTSDEMYQIVDTIYEGDPRWLTSAKLLWIRREEGVNFDKSLV